MHCRKEAGHCFLAVFSPPQQICRFSRLPSLLVLISVLGTARCHTGEVARRHTGGPEGFYLFSPCGWESTQRRLLILCVQCHGEENRCGNYRWLQHYRVTQAAFQWKQNWFTLNGLTLLTIIFCFIIQRQTLKKHFVNAPDSFRWKEVRSIRVLFQTLVLVTSHGFRKIFFSLILSCLYLVSFFSLCLGIQYHFLVYSALQCYQPSSSVCLITFKTAPLPRKTARDKLSALHRFFSQ